LHAHRLKARVTKRWCLEQLNVILLKIDVKTLCLVVGTLPYALLKFLCQGHLAKVKVTRAKTVRFGLAAITLNPNCKGTRQVAARCAGDTPLIKNDFVD